MAASFTIDKVSWHTSTAGNPESRDNIVARFYAVAEFLQKNNLTLRELVRSKEDIDDAFALHSDDLTEEGMAVVKAAYDKWLRKVDHGLAPSDVSMFQAALTKLRSGN